jgi:hypothetical protein
VANPTNDGKAIWQDFFLGTDGIYVGYRFKTWTGTEWIERTNIKVHYF